MDKTFHINMLPQPDLTTCGPTCLHALYQYYDDDISLDRVIREVQHLEEGGTLAVFLGCHALRRGYRARIYTYNLQVFDPTWFRGKPVVLGDKLRQQALLKKNRKISLATEGYLEFLSLGGEILFHDLTTGLIKEYLYREVPILTGLSATYLYNSMREYGPESDDDDVRGQPSGHFVVLCGYERRKKRILIADPYRPNPLSDSALYHVGISRLLHSILLGIVTYDANLLVIQP
ncbi:MAG TPA: hypothetical protein PK200_06475 [Spirochaetota bacterium]|nr:hypothetical protein [Spirochaetota bacterium]